MASYPPVKTDKLTLSEEGTSDLSRLLREALLQMNEQNGLILNELRLLNARFEAMAETHINESDVEK